MSGPTPAGDGDGPGPDPRRLDDDITRRFSEAARDLASGGPRRAGEPAPPARPLTPPGHHPGAPQDDRTSGQPLDATQRMPRLDERGAPVDTGERQAPLPTAAPSAPFPPPAAARPVPSPAAAPPGPVPPPFVVGGGPPSRPGPRGSAGLPDRGQRTQAAAGAAASSAGSSAGSSAAAGAGAGLGAGLSRDSASGGAARGPRRARLVVRRVDPWSVFKLAFVYSSCLLIVLVVAVATLRAVLETMGVFDAVTSTIQEVVDTGDTLDRAFSTSTVLSITAVVGAVNVVIVTALATLGAVLYNLCSDLVGGVEVTLADRD